MAQLLMELTNRCNLRCQHCYDERHAAVGDLPLSLLDKVLDEARDCGIDHLVFTGGEPTVHRQFPEIVRRVSEAGYRFSFVSNGVNFPKIYPLLLRYRDSFRVVTFSLDGARAATHDRQRGEGSYRWVMRAATLCVFKELPFTFNMVVTARNYQEIPDMIDLATRLGSAGVRFGHLMPTADTAFHGLDLSPQERRRVEARIWQLQQRVGLPVAMSPGYYSESFFFPCAPLELDEFNLDYRGNLTLCCQLSGYGGSNTGDDVIGNLHQMSLSEACARFRRRVATYLADKRDRARRNQLGELDHFPCWYCVKYLGKVPPSRQGADGGWIHQQSQWRRIDVIAE